MCQERASDAETFFTSILDASCPSTEERRRTKPRARRAFSFAVHRARSVRGRAAARRAKSRGAQDCKQTMARNGSSSWHSSVRNSQFRAPAAQPRSWSRTRSDTPPPYAEGHTSIPPGASLTLSNTMQLLSTSTRRLPRGGELRGQCASRRRGSAAGGARRPSPAGLASPGSSGTRPSPARAAVEEPAFSGSGTPQAPGMQLKPRRPRGWTPFIVFRSVSGVAFGSSWCSSRYFGLGFATATAWHCALRISYAF